MYHINLWGYYLYLINWPVEVSMFFEILIQLEVTCTIMDKSSAPSSIERNQFEALFRSEVMSLFEWTNKNGSSMHNKHCHWFILKREITSDRNDASNWFRSYEDEAEFFSMIVHHYIERENITLTLIVLTLFLISLIFCDLPNRGQRMSHNWKLYICEY